MRHILFIVIKLKHGCSILLLSTIVQLKHKQVISWNMQDKRGQDKVLLTIVPSGMRALPLGVAGKML